MPILHAPILEQAGFVESAKAAIEYVAQSDGATQYWQLSEPINLMPNDVIQFGLAKFTNVGTFKRFFGSNDFTFSLDTGADGDKFRLRSITSATLNGANIASDATLIPTAGDNMIEAIVGATRSIPTLLSLGNTNLVSAAIHNFKVIRSGVVIHEIPLTNKAQGATQLATVGNVNAFMPNYTELVWKDKSKL